MYKIRYKQIQADKYNLKMFEYRSVKGHSTPGFFMIWEYITSFDEFLNQWFLTLFKLYGSNFNSYFILKILEAKCSS